MTNWQIGDVKITRILELEAALPGGGEGSMVEKAFPDAVKEIGWLKPHFANEEGHLVMAVQAFLIETPSKRIIVDTCIGNDKKNRANPFFNDLQTSFLKDMEKAGWPRDSVDTVLCTHLHVDHVGWNTMLVDGEWVPTFPKAAYLIGKREWEHWQAEGDPADDPVLSDSVKPIFDAGLVELIDETYRIAPQVSVRPTPGHTPGHISVVIESGGDSAVITGDLIHHPCQMARIDWRSGFDTDADKAEKTRHAFLAEMADSPTLVIGTHFATPVAGHVKTDGDGYRLDVTASLRE